MILDDLKPYPTKTRLAAAIYDGDIGLARSVLADLSHKDKWFEHIVRGRDVVAKDRARD